MSFATGRAELVGGRRWHVDSSGHVDSMTRRYRVIRPLVRGLPAEEVATAEGLPLIGSAHPVHPALKAIEYAFDEGQENGKAVLYVDVTYSAKSSDGVESNRAPRGQAVLKRGWKSSSVARDMTKDAITGKALLNTAGQPFDSVPQIDVPAPIWEKVVRTTVRKTDWLACYGKVNSGAFAMGGITFGTHCVRCVQCDEEELWDDEDGYRYKYTIGLQVKRNEAVIAGNETATDIGWDIAAVSTGTMELKTVGGKTELVPVSVISKETHKEVFVSSPVLLDADGRAQTGSDAKPYAIRYRPYPETTFSSEMYS